jgi:hypothetical protein
MSFFDDNLDMHIGMPIKTVTLKRSRQDGFESISDIIHRLEDYMVHHRFSVLLSLQLDSALLLREEMNEGRH